MKHWSILGLLALAVTLLSGCGGGGAGLTGGKTSTPVMPALGTTSAKMTIVWPARGRLIPVAANYIRVVITGGTDFYDSRNVSRPTTGTTSEISFSSLPVGELTITATAHPDYYGNDIAQATATVTAIAKATEPLVLAVMMQSTITQVALTPSTTVVAVGGTRRLTATALNQDNTVVMVRPTGAFTWSSSNTSIATVDAEGVVTGLTLGGPVTITATEKESGKSRTAQVTVMDFTSAISQIHAVFAQIDAAIEAKDVTAFMRLISMDFLNGGETYAGFSIGVTEFLQSAPDNLAADTSIQNINIDGEMATVTGHWTITSEGQTLFSQDISPVTSDSFLTYLHYENGKWLFYGDQLSYNVSIALTQRPSADTYAPHYGISCWVNGANVDQITSARIIGPGTTGGTPLQFLGNEWWIECPLSSMPAAYPVQYRIDLTDENGSHSVYRQVVGQVNDFTTITSPTNRQTISTTTPTFRWQAVNNPDCIYEVILFGPPNGTGPGIWVSEDLTQPSVTCPFALAPGEYSWYVRVRSKSLNASTETLRSYFTVNESIPPPRSR